jgi:hypothetical protein
VRIGLIFKHTSAHNNQPSYIQAWRNRGVPLVTRGAVHMHPKPQSTLPPPPPPQTIVPTRLTIAKGSGRLASSQFLRGRVLALPL